MLLSGSVYSWNGLSAAEAASKLEVMGVDAFHIDCNDDPSVFDDIREIKADSHIPIDLHMITPDPARYYGAIRDSGLEICCFQHENLTGRLDVPDDLTCRLGLAVTMGTPIDVFEPYKDRFAFILLMTTTPGQSGGAFNQTVFQRIREFRARYPSKAIHVDGGVTDEVSLMLKNHGVGLIVVGSYLEKANSIIKSTLLIRGESHEKSAYLIRDCMSFPEEFPVLLYDGLTITALLKEMSSRRSGFAAIVNDKSRLAGIITDGDIRRAWLRVLETGDEADVYALMNKTPHTALDTATVGDMLEQVSKQPRTCLYLPVVDAENRLRGAISFQDLVKGGL